MTPREWFDFCATAGECWLATINPDDPACDHTAILRHYREMIKCREECEEEPPTHTVREVVQPVIDALRSNRLEGVFRSAPSLVCGVGSEDLALASFGDNSNESDWLVCAADDAIEHYIETWFGDPWKMLREEVGD